MRGGDAQVLELAGRELRITSPDKVLFGSDAFDGGPEQGWEQVAWVGTTTARRALAVALTGMLHDGEINRPRAEELARMVMRQNALAAYDLGIR